MGSGPFFCSPGGAILFVMETMKEFAARRKKELAALISPCLRKPTLSIFQVGHDAGSDAYIKGKIKDAAEIGFIAIHRWFDETTSEDELLAAVEKDAIDESIDGIIVQLPLPKTIDESRISKSIPLEKDVDGFIFDSPYWPCTPKGIVDYLAAAGFDFRGKNATVLGRSNIVGKPMARILLSKDMNVTVLHSKTSEDDKRFYLAHADLVVSAIGRLGYLDGRFDFKKSAYLIDVGINRGEDGKLHGDILPGRDVAYQSPVPGGVGLLTRLALMENVYEAYSRRNK